jgi:hypothetical protein
MYVRLFQHIFFILPQINLIRFDEESAPLREMEKLIAANCVTCADRFGYLDFRHPV